MPLDEPPAQLPCMPDVRHSCLLYRDDQERVSGAGRFIGDGLVSGEKVIYVAEVKQVPSVAAYLRTHAPDVSERLREGQLEVLPPERVHLVGRAFDCVRTVQALAAEGERARGDGWKSVRVAVEMTGSLKARPSIRKLVELEAALNAVLPAFSGCFLCLYDAGRYPHSALLAVFLAHPGVVVGTECVENTHHAPRLHDAGDLPEAVLAHCMSALVDRKHIKDGLKHRLAVEAALAEASALLIAGSRPALDDVMRTVGEAVGAHRTYVCVFEEGRAKAVPLCEWDADGVPSWRGSVPTLDVTTRPWFVGMLSRGDNIVLRAVDELPAEAANERKGLLARGVRSALAVPFHSRAGELLGFMGLDDVERCRDWANEDVRLLRVIGEMIGAYLHRVESEEALRLAEEQNTLIVESMRDVVCVQLADRTFISVNRVLEELTGIPREDWIGSSPESRIHPDDQARGREAFRRAFAGGSMAPYELRLLGRDGDYRDMELKHTPIIKDSRVIAVLAVARDVTDRKRNQETLRESERMLSTLMSNLPGMAYRCRNDLDWSMEFVSQGALPVTGYSPKSLMAGDPAYGSLIHPDDAPKVWSQVQEAIAEKRHFELTYRIKAANGEEKWIWEQGRGVFAPDGAAVALEGYAFSMTGRVKAEEARKQSEANYRAIFDAANDAIAVHDGDCGEVLDVNRRFCQMFECTPDEARRLPVDCFCAGWSPYAPADAMEWVCKARSAPQLFEWLAKDLSGRTFWVEVNLKRAVINGQQRILAVIRDISERKRLEDLLRQSQKLEAVGRLAGGAAHDFNNLLAAVMGYADLVLYGLAPDSPLRKDVDEIKKTVDRATALTRQLLTFSRKQILELKAVDLNETVLRMEKMLRLLLGDGVAFEARLAEDASSVKADTAQIEQVILNLVGNARDAMNGRGKLVIATSQGFLGNELCARFMDVAPGRYVILSVSDTGQGIDAETRSHLFEPFYTTKARGKGTGLGLATVYGIVKQCGGGISVSSEPGKGTTFEVCLPRFEEAPPEVKARVPAAVMPAGSRIILLVEDEEVIREFMARVLESSGHRVLKAADGAEALDLCREKDSPIDLMVTDLMMPGMDGRELAERAVDLRPGLRVVYMSGYADSVDFHRSVAGVRARFMQKPFTSETLLKTVGETLAE